MMSEYMFCVGKGLIPRKTASRMDEIARQEGAFGLNNPNLPGEGYRYWFAGPNLGEPFDSQMARRVVNAIRSAGLSFPDKK